MGWDRGSSEGNDEGRAKKDGASADVPRDASDGRVSGLVFIRTTFFGSAWFVLKFSNYKKNIAQFSL